MRRIVVVTGATGFIGRLTVCALVGRGCDVRAAVHRRAWSAAGGSRGTGSVTSFQIGDDDDTALRAALSGASTLVHAAALIPAAMEDVGQLGACLDVNTERAVRAAGLAFELGVRLVHISTAQLYDCGRDEADEATPAFPSHRAAAYLTSKLAADIIIEHLRTRGLDSLILRLASCYGPGMPSGSAFATMVARASRGERVEAWHGGLPRADYVYAADVADAIATAAMPGQTPGSGSGAAGIMNLGTGRQTSLAELAEAIAHTFTDRGAAWASRPLDGSAPPSFPAIISARARAALGFSPRPLTAGLAAYRHALESGA